MELLCYLLPIGPIYLFSPSGFGQEFRRFSPGSSTAVNQSTYKVASAFGLIRTGPGSNLEGSVMLINIPQFCMP